MTAQATPSPAVYVVQAWDYNNPRIVGVYSDPFTARRVAAAHYADPDFFLDTVTVTAWSGAESSLVWSSEAAAA